jgi:NAD(P)-dependent dehydrogenase (short-subunit alcohol dehydrogenase family)
MATPPTRTVLITGGNGSLGSQTAYKIAQSQSGVFFLLTARKPNDANAQAVSEQLRTMGVETFEFMVVDLGNFASVRAFASTVSERVEAGKIPPIEVIINSAAYSSYIMDKQTEDGFDPVYQTNVLSPFLLSVLLLKSGFRKIEGRPQGRIINVSSETVNFGDVAFFDSWGETEARKTLSGLGVKLGLTRYGSSKLIMDVAMYTLRERLLSVSTCHILHGCSARARMRAIGHS